MTDDKGNEITEPLDQAIETADMQDQQSNAGDHSEAESISNRLGGLMAGGSDLTDEIDKPELDCEDETLRIVEAVLADGQQALEVARQHVDQQLSPTRTRKSVVRKQPERVLRILLGVNILAMAVVAMLPSPVGMDGSGANPVMFEPMVLAEPATRQMSEPFNRALLAAENGNYSGAVDALELHLESNPRMHLAEQLSVMTAASYYALRNNDFKSSLKYAQLAQSLQKTQSSEDDLTRMAEAAVKSGDQEAMRRTWASFMMQQRQMPTLLYQQVARAYLQLSDGYSSESVDGTEAARIEEISAATNRLRSEVAKHGAPK